MAKKILHPAEKWLGKEIRDASSGMTGVCCSLGIQANGNVMVGIQPLGNGKERLDAVMFDENTVDLISDGISARVPEIDTKPEFGSGDQVEHTASPFTGTVGTRHWFLNGCVAYVVTSPVLGANGKPIFQTFFKGELRKAKGKPRNEEVAATPKTGTGGPPMAAPAAFR